MKNALMFSVLSIIFIAGCTQDSISSSSLMHECTQEEKDAEICTLEYMPVCGSDGITYGNGCQACAADVDSWNSGECSQDSSGLAASSAPLNEDLTHCSSNDKFNHMCLNPVDEVCGNDGLTYENSCRACSFGVDSYTSGACSEPNSWNIGFASLAASTNETRYYFDFSSNLIIQYDYFNSIMSDEVNSSDVYLDEFGGLSANCHNSICSELMLENELSYANMQVMPNGTAYPGISGLQIGSKIWVNTFDKRTVKLEILSVDENNGITFNWAIKI